MRLAWVAAALAMLGARADAAPPRASWADWIGDWDGKLAWSGCTVDGEPAATIAIDATDGALSIDLGSAGGALSIVPLAAGSGGGWSGRAGDVVARVARSPSGASGIELAVELDSGCAMHGSLRRASVGIAACDELVAWARIEGRCTRLVKPALEDVARVAHQRAEWAKSPADARGRLAAQCKARASKVEAELGAVGCAPDPDGPAATEFPECNALQLAAAKIARCQTLAFDVATMLVHEAHELVVETTLATSDRARAMVEAQCRDMRDLIAHAVRQGGCVP